MLLFYDSDGRIYSRAKYVPPLTADEISTRHLGENYVTGTTTQRQETHWVDGGVLTARAALSVSWNKTTIDADGVDEAILSGLPQPCSVWVEGVEHVITDGSAEITADVAADYSVVVDEPGYLAQSWIITAE